MNIIEEIQIEAVKSDCDIVSLLRKAYVISHKLHLEEFEQWVSLELKGYNNKDTLPLYRKKIRGTIKYYNVFHGWQPIIMPEEKMTEVLCNRNIYDSVPKIIELLKGSGNLTMTINQDVLNALWKDSEFGQCETYLFIDRSVFGNIVEQVKNKILEWALMLEDSGIYGNGISFSEKEVDIAKNTPNIINYTNNFFNGMSNAMIQQGSESSNQNLGNELK